MKLDDLRIGVSPLTDRVYVGTVSKRSPGVWASKSDCTSRLLAALMEWTPPGNVREFADSRGNRYEIEIRKLPDDRSAAPSGEEEVTRLVRWLTAPRAKGTK